ncbi:MAG: D-alanyl-D-alanine carboxypeptidase/D-alanyl-D-alanine-endopeptidase [Candidatus Sumerlaeaceae bacterium]|nr:D-alanyl-D-alanine carboxypeptidase/D-alanyl-D-alanine-endopeptidase [Candidatus Sumerlaeaceae bacterium]
MRLLNRFTLFSAFLLACHTAALSQTPQAILKPRIDSILDAPRWSNARWGVLIADLTTSEILYERDADKSFMPASNMKLYPTASAIKLLGPDFKYETHLYANGPITRDGTLRGDLVIVGSGDPSISGRYLKDTPTTAILRQWADAITSAGIRRITGSVIGDDDIYTDDQREGTWQLDYYKDWFAAESSGLSINDNCWDAVVRPGAKIGAPAIVELPLKTRYYTIKNEIVTTGAAKRKSEDSTVRSSRELDENVITLKGEVALGAAPENVWGSIHNGTLYCATMVREELQRHGVRVAGPPLDADDIPNKADRLNAPKYRLLHTHISPPLSRILAIINKPSQNFYADMLIRTLGARFYKEGSVEKGRLAVRDVLTTAGADASTLAMVDGSGLSRQNLVQPRMTLALLALLAASPEFQVFYDSLPIMGVDGTLKSRGKGTPIAGNVHAKTGYINRVRCLSGYVTTRDQHRVAFSLMANNYTVETKFANDAQDSITQLLANLPADTTETLPLRNDNTTGNSLAKP